MEKRESRRINVQAQGVFYIKENEKFLGEFEGTIKDVSEGGIRVLVNLEECKDLFSDLKEKATITFEAYEKYTLFDRETEDIFSGRLTVVRKVIKEDVIELGCQIASPEDNYEQYVLNRKTSIYLEQLKKI